MGRSATIPGTAGLQLGRKLRKSYRFDAFHTEKQEEHGENDEKSHRTFLPHSLALWNLWRHGDDKNCGVSQSRPGSCGAAKVSSKIGIFTEICAAFCVKKKRLEALEALEAMVKPWILSCGHQPIQRGPETTETTVRPPRPKCVRLQCPEPLQLSPKGRWESHRGIE